VRALADASRIERLMEALTRAAEGTVRIYFVGGTSAVLVGWRSSTVDVDLTMRPDEPAILRALPELKERLDINIELASPADFIPLPAGWEARSPVIRQSGRVAFLHFDFYCQALAKVERGHRQDMEDVRAMVARELVLPGQVLALFDEIEPELYRFPAIDPPSFRRAVVAAFQEP
jgi:hypothetical protein